MYTPGRQHVGSRGKRKCCTLKPLKMPREQEYQEGISKGGNCHTMQGLPAHVKDLGLYPKRSSEIDFKCLVDLVKQKSM